MKVNASKIQLTNDILERGFRWYDKGVSLKNAEKSPKYLVIYWDDLSVEEFEKVLPTLDKYYISFYLECNNINNKEILFMMLKYVETSNEEYLWIRVVDSGRLISHELYLANSYRENFELWYKVYEKTIEKISAPSTDMTVEEIVSLMDAKHESPEKIKERNRIERVGIWMDSIIDVDFVREIIPNTEINHLKLKFKNGIKMPHFGYSHSSLKSVPVENRHHYYKDLSGEKAMILNLYNDKITTITFYPEFEKLVRENHQLQLPQTGISEYVEKWFKSKEFKF